MKVLGKHINRVLCLRGAGALKPLATTLASVLILVSLSAGQAVSDLYSFPSTGLSQYPQAAMTQGRDSALYSVTSSLPGGSAYELLTTGLSLDRHAFNANTGSNPSGLTLARDGNFYGTGRTGGNGNRGVLFKMSPSGEYTVIHYFAGGSDGQYPFSVPIEASDGNLYGTTAGDFGDVGSTIYKYNLSGAFSTLYQFDGTNGQGVAASLLQASDGKLYGTASAGGAYGCGTVFWTTTTAAVVGSYSFHCRTGGSGPSAALIQASDGNLYGTTSYGGTGLGFGTVFKFVPQGKLSILYRFQGNTDGSSPETALVQATDGNLYGTTTRGGGADIGTVFQLTTGGDYKQLYSFVQATGQFPQSSLLQHTNGMLYGTANQGGANGYGAVYSLDLGLGPFVTFVRSAGPKGQIVQILGQQLADSTGVTFNGVAATFKVIGSTYMMAVVPAGATTGPVVVTTPNGTLTSNINFRVTP